VAGICYLSFGKQIHRMRPNLTHSETLRNVDTRFFDRLFTDLAPRVRGYLRRLTQDTAEAEDLTQEVFLAAYAARKSYKGDSQPLGWLLGIARRRWRDRRRGIRLQQVEMPEDRAAASPNVGDQVVRAAHLEVCLSKIDPSAREAVLLVFGEGLTYAEAAERLQEPVGTVKWRVHVASKTLRTLLRADENEDQP
jgi:RNA polymerase sigma-70 factor (ECF subfamily)